MPLFEYEWFHYLPDFLLLIVQMFTMLASEKHDL